MGSSIHDPSFKRPVPGAAKLALFLQRNGITFTNAGAALGVSRVTVTHWASGYKRPKGRNPANIEVWTGGEIPRSDWADPGDVPVEIKPFQKPIDDAPPPPASGPTLPAHAPDEDSDAA